MRTPSARFVSSASFGFAPLSNRLDREEYVEQAYAFRTLRERIEEREPLQRVLAELKEESLATTKFPMAIDFLLTELRHTGVLAPGMKRIAHYFTPFQAYLIEEAENERGRFDMRLALEILRFDAQMRSDGASPTAVFLYCFECLCRNRLSYDRGIGAMAPDPWYPSEWQKWIAEVRHQLGLLDLADMIFVRSRHYLTRKRLSEAEAPHPILFTEKEGRIALANRKKEPLYLFAALQRHLGYPTVPRNLPRLDDAVSLLGLQAKLSALETRIKMMEEEQRAGAVDLEKLYPRPKEA
jgi:hypothetical protein